MRCGLQCRIKVGAIDAAALGPFKKYSPGALVKILGKMGKNVIKLIFSE